VGQESQILPAFIIRLDAESCIAELNNWNRVTADIVVLDSECGTMAIEHVFSSSSTASSSTITKSGSGGGGGGTKAKPSGDVYVMLDSGATTWAEQV